MQQRACRQRRRRLAARAGKPASATSAGRIALSALQRALLLLLRDAMSCFLEGAKSFSGASWRTHYSHILVLPRARPAQPLGRTARQAASRGTHAPRPSRCRCPAGSCRRRRHHPQPRQARERRPSRSVCQRSGWRFLACAGSDFLCGSQSEESMFKEKPDLWLGSRQRSDEQKKGQKWSAPHLVSCAHASIHDHHTHHPNAARSRARVKIDCTLSNGQALV